MEEKSIALPEHQRMFKEELLTAIVPIIHRYKDASNALSQIIIETKFQMNWQVWREIIDEEADRLIAEQTKDIIIKYLRDFR